MYLRPTFSFNQNPLEKIHAIVSLSWTNAAPRQTPMKDQYCAQPSQKAATNNACFENKRGTTNQGRLLLRAGEILAQVCSEG